ncbi:uncharacterized protein BXZ73DRAFT_97628 [Epithele typhae]|uniref:uncharacterized protein n=1 Tax=Epithele typhae TaxID=378194 RepID=UPI002008BCE5|nr:uncharacterized protein BXZ73DRAFT_97628 [Epithele typhae]KAH9942208.1 hypothetical protein BXZ73DRAFT_97628 [Epithele typhae]
MALQDWTSCLHRSKAPSSPTPSSDMPPKTRRHPRPLARHLVISLTTSVVLLAAFILFLLVGLSLPIIKTIWIFHIKFITDPNDPVTSVATELRFGVWGICALSELGNIECFGPMLGYTIPDEIAQLTGYPDIVDAVAEGLLIILILHLVAAGLSLVGVGTSLFLESHGMCIVSLITSILTLLLGLAMFAIDLILILIGKQKISSLTDFNYEVNWGAGLWLVLAAVILSFIGMILMSIVVCECCGVGRRHRHHHHHHHDHQHDSTSPIENKPLKNWEA